MTNTDHDETIKEQIEQAIINYRIKCDMAVSERDDGFYTQKEYEEAITFELDKAMQLILKDRERAVREALIDGIEESHKKILEIVYTYTHPDEPNFCDVDDVSRVAMGWKVDRIAELSNLIQETEE